MKIILAQLRKDVVSARALFWAWAICLALEFLFFLVRRFPLDLHVNGLGLTVAAVLGVTTGMMAMLGGPLLSALLVVRIIHDDPLTEPNAFWRTRPIARPVLLTEKMVLISLVLTANYLLTGLAVNSHGVSVHFSRQPPTGELTGIAEVLQFLQIAAGLAAFAVLTSNLTKLILSAFIIFFASSLAGAILLSLMGKSLSHPGHALIRGTAHPAHWQIALLYTSGFGLVIVWQYLTLRTNIAIGILCVTFLAAALWQGF